MQDGFRPGGGSYCSECVRVAKISVSQGAEKVCTGVHTVWGLGVYFPKNGGLIRVIFCYLRIVQGFLRDIIPIGEIKSKRTWTTGWTLDLLILSGSGEPGFR